MPFGNDGDFSDTAFQNRVNSTLANEVGNLAMRTLSMAVKNCEGRVPLPVGAQGEGPIADRRTLSLSAEDEGLLKSAGGGGLGHSATAGRGNTAAAQGVGRDLAGET